MSTFSYMKGVVSELAALVWLKHQYPDIAWRYTERFSDADMRGVDILGTRKGGGNVSVQVKSSERYIRVYSKKVHVLIIPQDDRVPHFLPGGAI